MKNYKIPEKNVDLQKYARWKNLKYPIIYLCYIAFFVSAFVFFIKNRYEDAPPLQWWVYPVFAAAVIISGWIVCFMSRFVSDKSVCGVIKEMSFSRNYGRGLSRDASFSLDDHTYLKISCITDQGKKERVTVHLFEDGYDCYYREGGTLIKFRGLSYPLCLESEADGAHLCAVCGVRTYYKEGKMIHGEARPEMQGDLLVCRSCGHTLINLERDSDNNT